MKEEWRDILGYENYYQISNLGRVKSLDYIDKRGWKRKSKKLKYNIDRNGYVRVKLTNSKGQKYYQVHRLVAQAFIPNPNNLPQVNHKDSIRNNNCVNNLEWITCSENNKYAYNCGKRTKKFGKDNHRSKKIIQYTKDGIEIKRFDSLTECAKELKLNEPNISMVCSGKRQTCGGYVFKKEEEFNYA